MEKYLQLDFYGIDQKYLEASLRNYGQLRDYYCLDDYVCNRITRVAHCVLTNILANAANATLIAPGHPMYEDNGFHAKVYPGLQQVDEESRTIAKVWSNFFSHSLPPRETPEFIQIPFLELNYVLCAVLQRKHDSIWQFSLFTDPFDFWIWMGTLLGLILVGMIAFSGFSNKKHGAFSPELLSSLEPLLSPGVYGHAEKSLLFVLWMLICMVLVTFYSGVLTSVVISPPPEAKLETVSHLERNNYSFIFSNKIWAGIVQAISVSSLSRKQFVPQDFHFVRRILNSKALHVSPSDPEFLFELSAGSSKVAGIMMWPYAMRAASLASKLIAADMESVRRKSKNRKCYVGKKMIRAGAVYYAMTPPESILLGRTFRRLIDSGIAYRWWDEFFAMVHSTRVQDRGRVINPTQISDVDGNTFEELHMEGKTITIFLLWIGSIIICCISFGIELLFHRGHVTSVETTQFEFLW